MFTDNQITRFQNGVNNVEVGDLMNSLPFLDPTKHHTFMEDFDLFAIGDWTVDNPSGGAGTGVLINGDGGRISITTGAGASNDTGLTKTGAGFAMAFGKRSYFRATVQVDDATESDIVVGLMDLSSNDPSAPDDGFTIVKTDGGTSWLLRATKNNVPVDSASFGVTTDDTDITVGFFWDGISRAWLEVGGAAVGFMDPAESFPDDTVLTPVAYVSNGGLAQARVLQVDYLFAAQER